MDSSSGKSTRSRFAICSGLHDVAHRRSAACGRVAARSRRTSGPGTGVPSGRRSARRAAPARTRAAGRSPASFATFGRLGAPLGVPLRRRRPVRPLACLRVAALRRSSREIVDGDRGRAAGDLAHAHAAARARSRSPRAQRTTDTGPTAGPARSAASRQRDGTTASRPPATRRRTAAASSLDTPRATACQNRTRSSRRAADGRPGDHICAAHRTNRLLALACAHIATPPASGVATTS